MVAWILAAGASGCMPLPPSGGLAVSAGPLSDQWVIQWDAASHTPLSMRNRSLEGANGDEAGTLSDSQAQANVLAVFDQHRDWFRMRPGVDGLRVVWVRPGGWLKQVRLEQTYKGIPVGGAGYEAHVLPGGRIGSIEGRLHPDLELVVEPLLQADAAEARARSAFAGINPTASWQRFSFEYENALYAPRVLVIVPQGSQFRLAWGIVVPSPSPESSRVYVDAISGSILGYQLLGRIEPR